jgi:hypothetical protein
VPRTLFIPCTKKKIYKTRSSGASKFGISLSSLVAKQRKASKKSDISSKPYRGELSNIVPGSGLIVTDPDSTKNH